METVKQRIEHLKKRLLELADQYYNLDQPTVSDEQYDALMLELKALESEHPELLTADSPSLKVGGSISKSFKKASHRYPMQSLENAFDPADVLSFVNSAIKAAGSSVTFTVEPKVDGLSLALIYERGRLIRAITRGDGTEGEDVTANALAIKSIPKRIPYDDSVVEFRGEVFMTKQDFVLVNQALAAKGGQPLSNPRNGAAGGLRQLDPAITASRRLSMAVYAIPDAAKIGLKTQVEIIQFAQRQGFRKFDSHFFSAPSTIVQFINEFDRDSLPYVIDGLVVKVNELSAREAIGYNSRAPRWAIAYKFPAEVVETRLVNILPTVGRTGRVTYNAVLEPVRLAGTTVTAATLHNADYVKDKDIRLSDFVHVYKAGEIIPKVIGPVLSKRSPDCAKWTEALDCPVCGSVLVRYDGEVDQYCENAQCAARILETLEHFCSRHAMDIDGLGPAQIKRFYDLGLLRTVDQIYELPSHKEAFLATKNSGEKSFEKIASAIVQSKSRSLERLINGIGIRLIGVQSAKQLAQSFLTMDALAKARIEDIVALDDFGLTTAEAVVAFFANEQNQSMIAKLKGHGVNMAYVSERASSYDTSSPFYKKRFVITGTLDLPREEIKRILEQKHGAIVLDAVTKKTDFLLAGQNAGSKLEKALELGVKVVSLSELQVKDKSIQGL